jgi:probable rRNA maturation factor
MTGPASAPAPIVAGRPGPVSRRLVAEAVRTVLRGERRPVSVSVSFVGPDRMRRLNERWKGEPAPTDVLAFRLAPPGTLPVGDLYVCPAVARYQARALGVPVREELLRLVIHGTLHVLGYDHPTGPGRTRSAMWRKQERYLACVV